MDYLKLTAENIDIVSDEIGRVLKERKYDSKKILSSKLMMEEVMLKYKDIFGEDIEFKLNISNRFKITQMTLVFKASEAYNPLNENNESGTVIQSYLSIMGLSPYWNYRNGENTVLMNVKREKRFSMIQSLLFSVVLAIVIGLLLRLLPKDTVSYISDNFLTPIFDAFMRALTSISGPMIFLSVIWGIYGIGDTITLEIIGKKMISGFLFGVIVFTCLSCAILLPFFKISFSGGSGFDIVALENIILDIIPGNIIVPFANNNTLQIIFMAVVIGLAALILGKKANIFNQFIEHTNYIVQLIMAAISGMINIFIFLSILTMILSGDMGNFAGIYKILPMIISCGLISMIIHLIITSAKHKVPVKVLLKKMLPTFIIAISTASSAAAFSANIEGCGKLGIDDKISNFGVPLGQVVYCIGTSISFLVMGLCMADYFNVDITPQWLFTLLLCTIVLAIATPPIPGGTLTCFTIFALQLGLPDAAVSLCVTINIINDFIATSVNLFCLQCRLVNLSDTLGLLDKEKLKS